MDKVPATCRWQLTFFDSSPLDLPANIDLLVRELRERAKDPSLKLLDLAQGSLVLTLESSWDGMMSIDEQIARHQFAPICDRMLKRIDLVFDQGLINRLTTRTDKDPFIRSFARRYGPVFDGAVASVLRKASWSAYVHDELLDEVWIDFLSRAEHILKGYDAQLGGAEGYLYRVAENKARDFLRAELRREFVCAPPGGAKPGGGAPDAKAASRGNVEPVLAADGVASDREPQGGARRFVAERPSFRKRAFSIDDRKLQVLPATDSGLDILIDEVPREELGKLYEALKSEYAKKKKPAERQMWDFFIDTYYEGLKPEELMAKYQLKPDAVYKRSQRLREKIQELWRRIQKP